MIRLLMGIGIGVAAGYGVSRYIEAKAVGLPLNIAFKPTPQNLLTSVRVLKAQLAYDPDAPMEPTMLNGVYNTLQ